MKTSNLKIENRIMFSYLRSFLARTLVSNFIPFLATYSASLSITGWISGGGGIMATTGAIVLKTSKVHHLYK